MRADLVVPGDVIVTESNVMGVLFGGKSMIKEFVVKSVKPDINDGYTQICWDGTQMTEYLTVPNDKDIKIIQRDDRFGY